MASQLRKSAAKASKPAAKAKPNGKGKATAAGAAKTGALPKKTDKVGTSPSGPQLLNKDGNSRRKVLILYTGGTIGMSDVGGTLGLVPGSLLKQLQSLQELNQMKMPQCHFDEFSPILDSADMCPEDWCKIAGVIEKAYYEYDGFVVLHGTDTMAYTASALSFMLEQLAKPVVLTGSQLPFAEPLTDARQNLLGAIVFAGLADLSEVCIFFGGKLFRGNRSKKVDATSLEAFQSPNYPHLAKLGTDINIYRRRLSDPPRGRFRVHKIHVTQIVVMWVIPGFSDEFFECLLKSKSVKGVVLMLYGCGNAPARKVCFLKCLRKMVDAGIVVVACSQCSTGNVVLEKYAVGKAFSECGVISASDMTTEATVAKLAYLMSKGLSSEDCRKAMQQNLRGEMSTEMNTLHINEPMTDLSTRMS
ncbi:unnamed protein product [Polarella glacialis]|uniref:asparaginase n=1 Tax=Polarella glacialis TaxID=89957 RepID=A0A813ESK1_POLGL|nr:unnamed protein product [Polarella glacialis]